MVRIWKLGLGTFRYSALLTTVTQHTTMACPPPFLNAVDFPPTGGDTRARFCETVAFLPGSPTCCLPCPAENWFYSDRIRTLFTVSEGVCIAGLICAAYLLLSYAILPPQYTGRHYLSVSLVIGVFVMTFALVIPLLVRGPVCADAITPHDMKSNLSCAFSGSLLIGGGWAVVCWAFLRTLSVHLQICWRFSPGKVFFYGAQLAGWGSAAVFVALPVSLTGFAYRFGDACHLRSKNSLGTYWGPLLAVAAVSIVLQLVTLVYCIKVYVASLLDESTETTTTGVESVSRTQNSGSVKTLTARQTLRRIQKVLAMQWRGIALILLVLGDVVFLATIFLGFNAITERTPENSKKSQPWLICMATSAGDKNKCLPLAKDFVIPESTAFAMLFLLSCNGIWALLLLGRFESVTGWINLFRSKFGKTPEGDEFISYNAALEARNPRSFEMLAKGKEVGKKESDLESYSTDSRNHSRDGPAKPDYIDGLYKSKAYKREYPLGNDTHGLEPNMMSRFSTGSLHTSSNTSIPAFESIKMPPYASETREAHSSAAAGRYNFEVSTRPESQSQYGVALGSPGFMEDDDDQPRGLKYPPHARYF